MKRLWNSAIFLIILYISYTHANEDTSEIQVCLLVLLINSWVSAQSSSLCWCFSALWWQRSGAAGQQLQRRRCWLCHFPLVCWQKCELCSSSWGRRPRRGKVHDARLHLPPSQQHCCSPPPLRGCLVKSRRREESDIMCNSSLTHTAARLHPEVGALNA